MIYDNLSDWRRYIPRNKVSEFCQAIEFLRTFTPDIEDGKHVLIEGLIYANVQSYNPKSIEEGVVEYHRDFVDLQTLLSGMENIYYCPTASLKEKTPYTADGDYGLYEFDAASATCCKLEPGNFAIFFPEEGHMPCIACSDNPAPVKKVVLKLHRSLFE
jgi:YhcH/YjgK/YiaL family protein